MAKKQYRLVAVIYDNRTPVGLMLAKYRHVNIFKVNNFINLKDNHRVVIGQEALQLAQSGAIDSITVESGQFATKGVHMRQSGIGRTKLSSYPSVNKRHLDLVNSNPNYVIGIPIGINGLKRLSMLVYGRDMKKCWQLLKSKRRARRPYSAYKGYDMCVLRNLSFHKLTPDVFSSQYKLLVDTTWFSSLLDKSMLRRTTGSAIADSKMDQGFVTKHNIKAFRDRLDNITNTNLCSMQQVQPTVIPQEQQVQNQPIAIQPPPPSKSQCSVISICEQLVCLRGIWDLHRCRNPCSKTITVEEQTYRNICVSSV